MKKSIELVYLEILNERCVLIGKDKWAYVNSLNGYIGEVQFQEIALEALPSGMMIMMDLIFEMRYGETQIDAVIVSETAIHMFEVKNLKSQYEYRNGVWTSKRGKLSRDYFTQMKRAGEIFEKVLRDIGLGTDVEAKLVFINEEDTVKIRDEQVEGQYLKRWQVKEYMRQLGRDADWGTKWIPDEVVMRLRERATVRKVPKERPVDVDVKRVYRGIVCLGCGGYEIDVGKERYHVVCQGCGYRESKEKAVLRTICDLAILDYDEPLRIGIMDYYWNQGKLVRTIRYVFGKYFKSISKGRFTEYSNPMQRMEDAYPNMRFKYRDYRRER